MTEVGFPRMLDSKVMGCRLSGRCIKLAGGRDYGTCLSNGPLTTAWNKKVYDLKDRQKHLIHKPPFQLKNRITHSSLLKGTFDTLDTERWCSRCSLPVWPAPAKPVSRPSLVLFQVNWQRVARRWWLAISKLRPKRATRAVGVVCLFFPSNSTWSGYWLMGYPLTLQKPRDALWGLEKTARLRVVILREMRIQQLTAGLSIAVPHTTVSTRCSHWLSVLIN